MNKQNRRTLRRLRKMIDKMEIGSDISRKEVRSNDTLSDLHFNSVYLMQISVCIYDEFGIDINADDLSRMTFTDIVKRVNEPVQLTTV